MKKRIFALIMAMCLALSLLPASVFAENESGSDVVYGNYGTGTTWTQDKKGTGTIEYKTGDGNTITLSKKATPLGDNTYRIDLEVKTTQTTTTTPPGAAATVLVLDTSGSMDYCAECGQKNYHASGCEHYQEPDWDNWFPDNSVKTEETRLAAAKTAATNFLDSYKGDTAGVGRYVSLVSFAGSASVKCDWQDVSTTAGYNAVVRAIRSLSANGGTNLDAGLKNAANQFTKSAVSGISKDSRNVIALTDGAPTKSASHGNGTNGSWAINNETANTAATLRTAASVYTVCFGAAGQDTYPGGSTVDVFLEKNIATPATADTKYAYNAADSSELNAAFKAITTSITTGISSGTVTDPMGPNISVKEKPEAFRTEDGKAYTWELANGVKSTDGSKTTYTYQLSYTVKLDTSGENFKEGEYYPTNAKTTFTSGDKTFEFPVPGVKGTIPSYQVKYAYTDPVPAGAPALPADETHKLHTDVNVAAKPALDGYVFSGWTTDDAAVSSDGKFKMPGQNVTLTGSWTLRSDLSYTVNYYWNGTTDKVAPSKTVGGQTFGAIVTEKPAAIDGYTAVSADSKSLTIGTGKNVINFYYYQNVTLTANSGTAVYDGEEHSVSGFTSAPDGADFSAVTVGAKGTNVGTYPAQFQEGTVGTVDATEKYIVAEAKDGLLTITPVGGIVVTITGITDSRPYSGAEQFVTGYTVSTSNPLYTEADFTFTGTATAKGTDAGTYMMGLTPAQFENTNPNFENVTFSVTDGALTITPRSVKLTSATAEKVYDGMPLTRPDVAITGDGFVAGEVSAIRATGTVTNVSDGEQPNTIVYTTSAGFKPGNYSIEKDEGTLKITPVTDKVTVTITGNDGSMGYDGNEHSVTGYKVESISNPLYTAADFAFSGTDSVTGTDAGTYMMGLTPAQFENTNPNFENVTFSVTDGSLQINPRSVKLTSATDEKVYDGQPLTNGVVTVSGDGFVKGEGAAYNVTGSQTNAGSSDNTFTYTLNTGTKADNYVIETAEGTLTVTPMTAEVVVNIQGSKLSKVYNGAEQSVTGYKVESISNPLYTAADFAFSGTDSVTGTDAGTYMMGLTPAQFENTNPNFENVTFSVTDGALTITPMPLTITAGSDSKAYNGTPLTNDTFTRTSLAAGDTLASVTVTGSQTDVGSSKNVASDAKLMRGDRDVTANYAIDYLPGTLTVTKNESAKLTAEAYKGVYDGGEHDAVVKTALSDLVDDSVWTYSYSLDGEHYTDEMPQVKNVGAYPVWVKATNDNYVDLVTVVTAEVTPATVLVTADSHEWIIAVKDTCVGDPEPALTYQAESPVAGETPAFSGELSREPGAERGKTYQILQGDLALADGENFLASNYVLQFVPGELTVKVRDITITKTVDVTKAFVGDKLTYTITVTNTGDVDLQDVAVVDEMLGIEQVIGELKAGESWTQQFTYTAQESDAGKTLVNTAVTRTKDEKTLDQVDSDGTEITQKPVPTGDQSMVGLWTATLLISAAGAAIILARKSRRSK